MYFFFHFFLLLKNCFINILQISIKTNKKIIRMSKNKIPHDRSFASHPMAKYWSEINNKKPEEVFKSTHTKLLLFFNKVGGISSSKILLLICNVIYSIFSKCSDQIFISE